MKALFSFVLSIAEWIVCSIYFVIISLILVGILIVGLAFIWWWLTH